MHGTIVTNIPNELRAITSSGIVAAADGIKDYVQNKTQEQVNKDVSDDLSEHNSKILQVQDDVFEAEQTIAQQQIEIESNRQEINAKQFKAGAIETDPAPTEDSDNLVRSGAIYQALKDLEDKWEYITQEEYDELVETGKVNPAKIYLIPEE